VSDDELPSSESVAHKVIWLVVTTVIAIAGGGILAWLLVGSNGGGFGDAFWQKWRALSTLFLAFVLAEPVGERIARALKSRRYKLVFGWSAVAVVGAIVFAALGPVVGPAVGSVPAAETIYPVVFLLSLVISAVSVFLGRK
jgi:hypothetical protein